jgi:predicted  nucleic acid-binding Zn-ribbon protein
MGKRPPIDAAYNYTGDELEQLRQRLKANAYTRSDIEREAAQVKKRLEELRDRWKLLKMEYRRIEDVIGEVEYRMKNIRR